MDEGYAVLTLGEDRTWHAEGFAHPSTIHPSRKSAARYRAVMYRLATARLDLRMFREQDLDAYADMCADEEVMRFIGVGGAVGADVAWRQMALFLGEWALHGYGMWAVEERASGRLIGRVGFLNPHGWPACELGWLLARDAWGRGFALEAARAAIAHGRAHLGVGGLISLIRPDNARSIALAQRLGATLAGKIEFLGGETLRYEHPVAA
jgi:RimJ/RimL family protein N-acetyltransferase